MGLSCRSDQDGMHAEPPPLFPPHVLARRPPACPFRRDNPSAGVAPVPDPRPGFAPAAPLPISAPPTATASRPRPRAWRLGGPAARSRPRARRLPCSQFASFVLGLVRVQTRKGRPRMRTALFSACGAPASLVLFVLRGPQIRADG